MISGGELPRSKRSNRVSIPIQKPPQKTIIQRMPANRRNRSRQLPNALLGHYARPHNATSTSVFLKLCVGVPTKKNNFRNRTSHDPSIAWSWIIRVPHLKKPSHQFHYAWQKNTENELDIIAVQTQDLASQPHKGPHHLGCGQTVTSCGEKQL